jgi:CAAX protease family protein
MEPGIHPPVKSAQAETQAAGKPRASDIVRARERSLHRVFAGGQGLRAGWSIVILVLLFRLFSLAVGTIAIGLDPALTKAAFSPGTALVTELIPLVALIAAGLCVARIEQRSILAYNLTGPRRLPHFFSGLAFGFVALSVLVAAMACGGWLRFGPVTLTAAPIARYAILWATVFLLVGLFEEGSFRCYLQCTLTRGINFWWALGIVGTLCLDVLLRSHGMPGILVFLWMTALPVLHGEGVWGIYAFALLGFFPCLALHQKRRPQSGFWQAAWVTSTFFGFVHITNNGENWIGIFAAAAIGFIFCVSIWLTGSAWWAIGCHAAWDWAETFFYGTADSGLQPRGHFLASYPAGSVLWSGGTDGPEGSLLVLAVILLLLAALVLLYRRTSPAASDPCSPAADHCA